MTPSKEHRPHHSQARQTTASAPMRVDFEGLVRSQGRVYYGAAYRALRNREDAEEAASDAFLAIHKAWERVLSSHNPYAMAYKIFKDTLKDRARALARRPVTEALGDDPADSEDAFAWLDARIDLLAALADLQRTSPRQTECVVLRYFLNESYEDIAAKLDITVDNARVSAHHGKRRLCHGDNRDTRPHKESRDEGGTR
ncbi:sigma-70 family RNA polymerase sigma factor [Streptomyces sp. NPDC039022]|uniref:RNA polymerase sigma factor n=1 Tax=unclassified Streptomyces TaxID=2593676 RepID=UPI0033E1CB77